MIDHLELTRRCQRGFNLMELLIVLGIITVLMAIALPSLFHAKNDALITVCLSNMHQLGIATESYGSENNDYLPWDRKEWGMGARWWKYEVAAPTGLDCPARTDDDKSKFGKLGYNISFSNWTEPKYLEGVDMPGIQVPDYPVRLSMISSPSKKVQIYEFRPWHFEGQIWNPPGVPEGEITMRIHKHGDRSPVSFVDGHAIRHDYTTFRDGWYPGTSKVWKSAVDGTVEGYQGRDVD